MQNEKGSILLETIIAFSLLAVFLASFLRLELSWKKRFRAILAERNSAIQKIRSTETTEFLDSGGPKFDFNFRNFQSER
jgi:hypothetical protein